MKIPQPKPIAITTPTGETIEVSARDVVEHVTKNGREFGQSRELEKVRQGARILAGFDAGEISDVDLKALRAALAKPSSGWFITTAEEVVRVQPTQENPAGLVKRKRAFAPSGLDLLPLLNGLLGD